MRDLGRVLREFEKMSKKMMIKKSEPSCDGLLFRGYSSTYCQGEEIGRREGFRLLKRKSCKGYPDCKSYDGKNISTHKCDHWFLDEMSDMLDCDGVIIPAIENNALYRIKVVNETHDWETGYCDGFDFEFYKVEEKKDEEDQKIHN